MYAKKNLCTRRALLLERLWMAHDWLPFLNHLKFRKLSHWFRTWSFARLAHGWGVGWPCLCDRRLWLETKNQHLLQGFPFSLCVVDTFSRIPEIRCNTFPHLHEFRMRFLVTSCHSNVVLIHPLSIVEYVRIGVAFWRKKKHFCIRDKFLLIYQTVFVRLRSSFPSLRVLAWVSWYLFKLGENLHDVTPFCNLTCSGNLLPFLFHLWRRWTFNFSKEMQLVWCWIQASRLCYVSYTNCSWRCFAKVNG